MTADRFTDLLSSPVLLSNQNETELDELVAHYPWCGQLRKLRLQLALVRQNERDIERWTKRCQPYFSKLELAGILHSIDAAAHQQAEQHVQFQPLELSEVLPLEATEEFAELPQLNSSDRFPEDEVEVTVSKGALILYPKASSKRRIVKTVTREGTKTVYEDDKTIEETASEPLTIDSTFIEPCISTISVIDWYLHEHELVMQYGRPQPIPKESFESYQRWKNKRSLTSWTDQLNLDLSGTHPSGKGKIKRNRQVRPEVASETLADLLASQGYTDRARVMYEQLILRYPARKTTFEARINELK